MPNKDKAAPEAGFDPVKAREILEQEKARLANAKEDLAGLREKLEGEFEAQLPTMLSEEERDTLDLDGDPVKQWQILSAKHAAFVEEAIASETQAVETFEEEIAEKERILYQLEAEARFKEKHPDLDFDGIAEWFEEDMPVRAKRALIEGAGGDADALLDAIKAAYEEAHPADEGDLPDLPADLSGVPGKSGDVDSGRAVETPNRASKLYGGR